MSPSVRLAAICNSAFICQSHNAQLGVNNIASTYMKSSKPVEKVVLNNASFLKNKFDLEVTVINKNLLNIYWTIKWHKILPKQGSQLPHLSVLWSHFWKLL